MANKVSKYKRVLRFRSLQGCGNCVYFRGSTLQKASPFFETKTEAKKWLKNRQRLERKRKG